MSWDDYVNRLKGDGTLIKEAAIWGFEKKNYSMWAHSAGLSMITAKEIEVLDGDVSNLFTTGLHLAGKRCTLVRDFSGDQVLWSLILSMKTESNAHTVCICKSLKAFVIALGHPGVKGGQMLPKVHEIVDHLKNNTF